MRHRYCKGKKNGNVRIMKIAYSSLSEAKKGKRPLTKDQERAELRLMKRKQLDFEKALIEFATEVKEIREYQHDWMPGNLIL